MQHCLFPYCIFVMQLSQQILGLWTVHIHFLNVYFLTSTMSILLQEYTLAHIDKPDTLAGAEKALKKHEDFVSTMEANEDKIDGVLQGGQRLVDSNNLYSRKVQEKTDSVRDRLCIVFV